MIAGFVLIGRYGIISSFRMAAIANVVVGAVAILPLVAAAARPTPIS